MRVFIGNQTSCWASTPTEPFDYALAQGFSAFEFFPDKKPGAGWETNDIGPEYRKAIREKAQALGIRLSVHARCQANPLSNDGLQLLWQDLDFACDLGAVLLNIHLFHEHGLESFVASIVPLVRKTAEAGIQLSLENTPLHSPEQFNELFDRLKNLGQLDTSHVGTCFDLGHANLSSATPNDYIQFYDRLNPQLPIIHLHLHENWGDADSHLPLFTGPASRDNAGICGLGTRLLQKSFSGSAIFEQWPNPPSLLNNARDQLRKLWNLAAAETIPHASDPERVSEPRPLGPTGIAADLVSGDGKAKSWREKLELVSDLLIHEKPTLDEDQLIDAAIYLRFLATGHISCAEDGRHFRPAHHARIAAQVQRRLAELKTPDNQFLLRKIYPWLPSSAPTFRRPEPLTRIRDIAHRNDIGSELKREIKTTLQNKLHRCAGPEDLATSSALLQRITSAGADYSQGFVEQFKIFHQELKEFFNASSLEERLQSLLPSLQVTPADLVRRFLAQKVRSSLPDHLAAMHSLTELRHVFAEMIQSKDGSDSSEYMVADIALEDFCFVLLSQIINDCQKSEPNIAMQGQTEALAMALDNLALGGVDPEESLAVQSELVAWGKPSGQAGRAEILRLKATVSRSRRLADNFGARIVALFSQRASELGRALGVLDPAIRVYSESDIRSHVVFQVSKLADALSRQIRQRLGLPPWDVIVPGHAWGRAVDLESLEHWEGRTDEPTLVLLQTAAGDEEIPKHVAALALAHEIPHLSHLSVRARQAGIIFTACEELAEFNRLRALAGKFVSLNAAADKVTWELQEQRNCCAVRPRTVAAKMPEARLSDSDLWIELDVAVPETSGAKAAGMRWLSELSRQSESGFRTPPALVIPFGVMENAFKAAPAIGKEYTELVKGIESTAPGELPNPTQRLREFVQRLSVPEAIVSEIMRRFDDSALIFRSSANCEDLEGFAGAGLYESVLNVPPAESASAIRHVWSSLWTDRAAASRQSEGIHHDQAHMAVLVQQLLDPDFAFVLHTVNPVTNEARELYAEIGVGLGETLVSAAIEGGPYRLTINKKSGAVIPLAFANFSKATHCRDGGGVKRDTLDYSKVSLSRDPDQLQKLGRRLCEIGAFVERALGGPQDIEGAVLKNDIYLVQARPQQGLGNLK